MKYDAFISYRHGGIDQFVAETLHKKLEAFKLPKRLREKSNGKERITRVFRDQDELPLSSNLEDSIKEALNESEWLIVICTPRLKESIWCLKEIETFAEIRGKNHILAVLVEGEPYESFPEQLRVNEVKKLDLATGQYITVQEKVEPLAADVRASSKSKIKSLMDTEILRLLAPMFDVDFDDLKQRQRARKVRRISILTAIVLAISVGFGVFATINNLRLQRLNNKLDTANEEITKKAGELEEANENLEELNTQLDSKMNELLYNQAVTDANNSLQYNSKNMKNKALAVAYDSVTNDGEFAVPKTSYASLALSEALDIYHYDKNLRIVDSLDFKKEILWMHSNGTVDYIVIQFADKTACLYDYPNRQVLWESDLAYDGNLISSSKQRVLFYSSDEFVVGDGARARFFKIENGAVTEITSVTVNFSVNEITRKPGSTSIYLTNGTDACVVDINTKQIVASAESNRLDITKDGTKVVGMLDGNIAVYAAGTTEPLAIIEPEVLHPDVFSMSIENDPDNPNNVYIVVNENYAGIANYGASCYSVNLEDGSINWKMQYNDYNLKASIINTSGFGNVILLRSNYSLKVINRADGSLINNYDANGGEEKPLDVVIYDDYFTFVTSDGKIIYFVGDGSFVDYTYGIVTAGINMKEVDHANSDYGLCFPAITKGSSCIDFYAYNMVSGLVELPDNFKSGTTGIDPYYDVEAKEKAGELGLDDAESVTTLIYIKDEKIAVTKSYTYLRVFDVETAEMLYETTYLSDVTFSYRCKYAVDDNGYIYLIFDNGAIVFDENRQAIAKALGAYDFDKNTQRLVYKSVYGDYEGSIYSLDELIEFARIRLGK